MPNPSCIPPRRYHAQRQRRLRAAVTKFRHATLCKAWSAWRAHLQRRQVKAAMLQHTVRLWAGNTTIKCWLHWRAYTAAERHRHASNSAAAQHYCCQLQRRALLALWLCRLRGHEERRQAVLLEGHMQGW